MKSINACMGFIFFVPLFLGFSGIPLDIVVLALGMVSRRLDALSLAINYRKPMIAGIIVYTAYLWSNEIMYVVFVFPPGIAVLLMYSGVEMLLFMIGEHYKSFARMVSI